jgi:hypothetical protein
MRKQDVIELFILFITPQLLQKPISDISSKWLHDCTQYANKKTGMREIPQRRFVVGQSK